jgi:AcrR family transcriptional regulator
VNTTATPPRRDAYHHGDLRNALTEAAADLARAGGPEAVVLREAARRVGVTPTAAYRHFEGQRDLLGAVKQLAQTALATTIEHALNACADEPDPGRRAIARLRATGQAYLEFAFNEPGLFNTAFCHDREIAPDEVPAYTEAGAFILLGMLLDELVAAGLMPAARRPMAEFGAWAAVHGLAALCLDGPLGGMDEGPRDVVVQSVLDGVIRSLVSAE